MKDTVDEFDPLNPAWRDMYRKWVYAFAPKKIADAFAVTLDMVERLENDVSRMKLRWAEAQKFSNRAVEELYRLEKESGIEADWGLIFPPSKKEEVTLSDPKCNCYTRRADGSHAGKCCSIYNRTGVCPSYQKEDENGA